MGVLADFFIRVVFCVALIAVVFFCLAVMFKKSHGRMVLAQLINTVNGDRIDITSWESAIGRAKTCDIVLNYSAVSRFHAVLARRNRGWMVFDTYSKTGVQVNGKLITKQAYVYDGDILTVGNVVMCFRSPLFKRDKKSADAPERIEPGMPPVAADEAPSGGRILSALQSISDDSIILLFSDEYIVGRASSCDIVLPVMTVSRRHSRLAGSERGWLLTDLASRTGTKINGRKISSDRLLRDDDIIGIGGVEYRFIENYMRE